MDAGAEEQPRCQRAARRLPEGAPARRAAGGTSRDVGGVCPTLRDTSPRRHRVQERVEGSPDLAIEIVSPRTARRDRGEKLRAYAELGVREYWIVDPAARQIEFLTNRDGRFQVELPLDGVYRSPLLPGIALDLVELWSEVEKRFPG